MMELDQRLMEKLEGRAWSGEAIKQRFAELAAENARLQGIVAELLLRNQELRVVAGA
jgi:hypothetical protein